MRTTDLHASRIRSVSKGAISMMLAVAFVLPVPPANAQSSRDTERKLQRVRSELKAIASER